MKENDSRQRRQPEELDPAEILGLVEEMIHENTLKGDQARRQKEQRESGENIHPHTTLSKAVAELSKAMFRGGKKDGKHEVKNIFPNLVNRNSAIIAMDSITHLSRLNTDCFPTSIVYTEFPQGSQTTDMTTFINIGFDITPRGVRFPFVEITEGPQYVRIAPDTIPSPASIILANKAASILQSCTQKLKGKSA